MPDAILDQRTPTMAEAIRSVAEAQAAAAHAVEASSQALALLARQLEQQPEASGPDGWLTVPEAARELRRSVSHVREQCRLRAITAMRAGKGYRIRRSALAAYERKRTA